MDLSGVTSTYNGCLSNYQLALAAFESEKTSLLSVAADWATKRDAWIAACHAEDTAAQAYTAELAIAPATIPKDTNHFLKAAKEALNAANQATNAAHQDMHNSHEILRAHNKVYFDKQKELETRKQQLKDAEQAVKAAIDAG